MSERAAITRAAGVAVSVGAALVFGFVWGMAVRHSDDRALQAHDSRANTQLAMAARGVCGDGAELATTAGGYLCVWYRADGGVYARPVMQSPIASLEPTHE